MIILIEIWKHVLQLATTIAFHLYNDYIIRFENLQQILSI